MKRRTPLAIITILFTVALCPAAAAQDTGGTTSDKPAEPTYKGDKAAAKLHWDRATELKVQRKYEEAVKEIEEAYKLWQHPDFLHGIGQLYRLAEKYDQAAAAYRRYLDAKPNADPLTWALLGECLLLAGKRTEANQAFDKYLKLEKNKPFTKQVQDSLKSGKPPSDQDKRDPETVKQAQALHDQAKKLSGEARWGEAAKLYMQGWDKFKMPEMLWNAGQCYYNDTDSYEAARVLEQYVNTPAAQEKAWQLLAWCYDTQGMLTKSRDAWQRYLKAFPNGQFVAEANNYISTPQSQMEKRKQASKLFNEADKHYKAGRYREALKGYQDAQNTLPHPSTAFNIARCYQKLQQWREALKQYEDVLAEDEKNHPDAHLRAAECLLEMNMPNTAEYHINLFKKQAKGTAIEKEAGTLVRQLEAKVKKVRDTEKPNPLDVVPSSGCAPGGNRTLTAARTGNRSRQPIMESQL